MMVECDFCGETVSKTKQDMDRCNHHFCNVPCYYYYKKEYDWYPERNRKTGPNLLIMKLEEFGRLRAKRLGKTWY